MADVPATERPSFGLSSIRMRVLMLVAVMLALVGSVGIGARHLDHSAGRSAHLASQSERQLQWIEALGQVAKVRQRSRDAVLLDDPTLGGELDAAQSSLESSMALLQAGDVGVDRQLTENRLALMSDLRLALVANLEHGRPLEAARNLQALEAEADRLKDVLESGHRRAALEVREFALHTARQAEASQRLAIWMGLAGTALTLGLALLLLRSLAPLGGLTRRLSELRKGDLAGRVPQGGHDEVGMISRALNQTLDALEGEALRREHSLRDALRVKSRFLATMSHELRTPLNAIVGYTEMIWDEELTAGSTCYEADLQRVLVAAKHLLSLIDDVLDLSRVEAGQMQPFHEEVDLARVMADVSDMVRPLMTKNGNRFLSDGDPPARRFVTDRKMLLQILMNLLTNAAKFTNEGEVQLSLAVRPGHPRVLLIGVQDTGIGMSPEQVSRVFDAFVQADSSTTRRFGGTGLGMTITQTFCELLGGHVVVDSSPGLGTNFKVQIPESDLALVPPLSPRAAGGASAQRTP